MEVSALRVSVGLRLVRAGLRLGGESVEVPAAMDAAAGAGAGSSGFLAWLARGQLGQPATEQARRTGARC